MNQKSLFATAAAMAVLAGLIAYMNSTQTQEFSGVTHGYRVVCLKFEQPIEELEPYYHIAHQPKEGGWCYFKFDNAVHEQHLQDDDWDNDAIQAALAERKDVKCSGAVAAAAEEEEEEVVEVVVEAAAEGKAPTPYSHSGMQCKFVNPKHKKLIERLKSDPRVSRDLYGGFLVRTKRLAADVLMRK